MTAKQELPQTAGKDRTLLFSAQKDEGPFLIEWIAYHKLIGFDDILIFSNDCSDGSDDLLDVLDAAGYITHIRSTPGPAESAQGHAADLTIKHPLYQQAKWACWIDADEFLNIHIGRGHVPDLIDRIGAADGAFLSWRLFGDSGHPGWQADRLTTAGFTRAAKSGDVQNKPVKCFFRTGPWIDQLYIHRPVFTENVADYSLRFIDNDGNRVSDDLVFGTRNVGTPQKDNHIKSRQNTVAQINHYAVRTNDVFQMKKFRGSGMKAIGASDALRGRRHGQHFWDKRNINDVDDFSIMRFTPALREKMAEMFSNPAILAAHKATCAAMIRRIAEVEKLNAEADWVN